METVINKQQDEKIDSKVSWQIFVWAMGIILIIVGIAINYALGANGKADNAIQQTQDIKGDIKSINTSLNFIQGTLSEIKQNIKK